MKEIAASDLKNRVIDSKGIIIYGAGILGQGLYCLLKMYGLEKKVIGFAVSEHTDHLNEFMGVPILSISEYGLKNADIFIAVKERYLEGVLATLGNIPVSYVGVITLKKLFEEKSNMLPENMRIELETMQITDEQYVTFWIRQIRRTRLDFEVNIVDHCNLNCQCCNHFSPLASNVFLEVDEFEKDMQRIAELTQKNVGRIWLIGGEPLLHPDIVKFLYISRHLFPKTHITLDTNGTLLLKQKNDFWQSLRDTDIELTLTKYPIGVDYEMINMKMNEEKIKYSYTLSSAVLKTTYHLPLDIEGKLNGAENYIKCWHANECVTLRKGRIYTCPIAAHAHYFNEFFDKNLYVGDRNSVSIYEVEDIIQILDFLKKPIPFCRHCDIDGYTYDLKWDVSKKLISEWT